MMLHHFILNTIYHHLTTYLFLYSINHFPGFKCHAGSNFLSVLFIFTFPYFRDRPDRGSTQLILVKWCHKLWKHRWVSGLSGKLGNSGDNSLK